MTIVKSFKYSSETNKETIKKHRTHVSKKNRRPYPVSLNCKVYKDRLQRLKEEEAQRELDILNKL
jgi:hypothetical protein